MLRLFLVLLFFSFSNGEKGCYISIDSESGDLSEPQPLILSDSKKVIYPDNEGILSFSYGESILLACPDEKNSFNAPFNSHEIIKASCVQGKQFQVNGRSYSFSSFTCQKKPKPDVKRRGTCLKKFSKVEFGFRIRNDFIPTYEICRDDDTDETYYAKAEMTESIGGHQTKTPRPTWMTHSLYKQNINNYYTQRHQREFFSKLLQSEELAQQYLKKAQLHRGHLAARSDFVYGMQQNATFTYANAAPQWSTFNSGNWKYIESAVRKFVESNSLEVTIYTGVHGQMSLRDVDNRKQPLSLDIDENDNGYIKVPKFFWKIVYDPVNHLALTLVGVNDPFSKEITKDMLLCTDISDDPSYSWLTKSWKKRTKISLGLSYVCDYNELKKIVHTAPKLKVTGSLESSVQITLGNIEAEQGCQITIDYKTGDLREPQPLILNSSFQILYPDQTGTLKFSSEQSILLACPGKANGLDFALKSKKIHRATCIQYNLFFIKDKTYPFHSCICKQSLTSIARKGGVCLRKFSRIIIGFQISKTFISILEICRDNKTHETYYVKAEMSQSIGGYQSNNPRPSWKSHNLFPGQNINFLYTRKNQVNILEIILNSRKLAQRYLKKYHLQRGHLAAKSDFVYATEQNSTFALANAAPQWSSFNSGNWKYIENAVRTFVVRNNLKVTIYTGVHGQMSLKDIHHKQQPIFLNIDKNNNSYIRVPKFFWKIVHDPIHHLAFTIIGVNDPFSEKITSDMFLCRDISDTSSFAWLTKSWKSRMKISLGVSYVCDYKEIKNVIHSLPDLKVEGILQNYF